MASLGLDAEAPDRGVTFCVMQEGELVQLTAGEQKFELTGGSFTVGPVTVGLRARAGETMQAVFNRVRGSIEVLFQAEYTIKRSSWLQRRKELDS